MAKRTAGGRKQRRLMCLSMHFPPPSSQSRCSSLHFKREKPGVSWRRNFTRHTKQTPASTFIAKVINFLYISGYPLSVKGEKSALLLFRMPFLFLALTKVDGWIREQAEGGKAKEKEKRGSTISLISSGGIGNTFHALRTERRREIVVRKRKVRGSSLVNDQTFLLCRRPPVLGLKEGGIKIKRGLGAVSGMRQ